MAEKSALAERCSQPQDNALCPRCGAPFTCGCLAGRQRCWCAELPVLASPEPGSQSCYCPACLRELTSRAG